MIVRGWVTVLVYIIFYVTEEFDERQFCRYYLKLYKRLKDLDRMKQVGCKFSKAFSEFTMLVYHNLFTNQNNNE